MVERTTAYERTARGIRMVYSLTLRGDATRGYAVTMQVGPRASRGSVTATIACGVSLAEAEQAFADSHQARLDAGFHVLSHAGAEPETPQQTPRAMASAPESITWTRAVALAQDQAWHAETLYAGGWLEIRANTRRIEAVNRLGRVVPLPIEIATCLQDLPLSEEDSLIQGVRMGTTFAPVDVLQMHGRDVRGLPRYARVNCLWKFFLWDGRNSPFPRLHVARTRGRKFALLENAGTFGDAGVIFKRADAPYAPKMRGADATALRFVIAEHLDLRCAAACVA